MNNCPKCGAKIYEGYDFCCECGCSLAEFKTAENPAVKNEACPNAEPAPAGATMNIPGTQEKRGSNKKKIAVFGAVAALLLIAILVVWYPVPAVGLIKMMLLDLWSVILFVMFLPIGTIWDPKMVLKFTRSSKVMISHLSLSVKPMFLLIMMK